MTFRLSKKVYILRSFLFYWIVPSQEITSTFIKSSKDLAFRPIEFVQIHHENQLLKKQVDRLSTIESQHQQLVTENQRLRQVLMLKSTNTYTLIPAEVSGRDSQSWAEVIWIDHGEREGIQPDDPVLAVKQDPHDESKIISGIVGRILDCGPHTSKVLLLSDPLSSVTVSLARNNEQGLVSGQGGFNITIEYLNATSAYEVGDEIVTNGLGGIFPPGLSVARLKKLLGSESGFRKAEIEPTIPLNQIKEVLVLKKDRS